MLPEGDRMFNTTLHNMDVKLICHDALLLAQLMGLIQRAYGIIRVVVCCVQALIDLFRGRVTAPININGCMLYRVCLLGSALLTWGHVSVSIRANPFYAQMTFCPNTASFCPNKWVVLPEYRAKCPNKWVINARILPPEYQITHIRASVPEYRLPE